MKCIAAISGGPDSMALLAWMEENKLDYVVCHVNYHKRDSAGRDEGIVRRWCQLYNKDLYILHDDPDQEHTGNFQDQARDLRYAFFEHTAKAVNAHEIYTAHHQDDLIETWFLQKERGSLPEQYGIQEVTRRKDLIIRRPFLSRTKKELEQFCIKSGIEYGIDESNLQNDYRRNQIRHEIVEKASKDQRETWLKQIQEDNENLKRRRKTARENLQFPLHQLLEKEEAWLSLYELIHEKTKEHPSRKSLEDLIEKLKCHSSVPYGEYELFADPESHKIRIEKERILVPFWVENAEHLERLKNMEFQFENWQISKSGQTIESVCLQSEDFPIFIRSSKPDDKIHMRFGTKKAGRALMDRKIPKVLRPLQPAVQNTDMNLVFLSGLGCDKLHFSDKPTFYMLKFTPCNVQMD